MEIRDFNINGIFGKYADCLLDSYTRKFMKLCCMHKRNMTFAGGVVYANRMV